MGITKWVVSIAMVDGHSGPIAEPQSSAGIPGGKVSMCGILPWEN